MQTCEGTNYFQKHGLHLKDIHSALLVAPGQVGLIRQGHSPLRCGDVAVHKGQHANEEVEGGHQVREGRKELRLGHDEELPGEPQHCCLSLCRGRANVEMEQVLKGGKSQTVNGMMIRQLRMDHTCYMPAPVSHRCMHDSGQALTLHCCSASMLWQWFSTLQHSGLQRSLLTLHFFASTVV